MCYSLPLPVLVVHGGGCVRWRARPLHQGHKHVLPPCTTLPSAPSAWTLPSSSLLVLADCGGALATLLLPCTHTCRNLPSCTTMLSCLFVRGWAATTIIALRVSVAGRRGLAADWQQPVSGTVWQEGYGGPEVTVSLHTACLLSGVVLVVPRRHDEGMMRHA